MSAVYLGIVFGVFLLLLVFFLSIDILYRRPGRRPSIDHPGATQRPPHKRRTNLKPAAYTILLDSRVKVQTLPVRFPDSWRMSV